MRIRHFILITLGVLLAQSSIVRAQLDPVPVPIENPITESKRVLGKLLFWEEQLSSDNTVACGTCHRAAFGGSDPRLGNHPGPDGVFNTDDDTIGSPGIALLNADQQALNDPLFGFSPQVTGRASPGIFMSMYAPDNFWDGRASSTFVDPLDSTQVVIAQGGSLESQAVGPIVSSVEMAHQGRDWSEVTSKLEVSLPMALATTLPADMAAAIAANNSYPSLFAAAFGDGEITPARIGMAIATYERTLVPDQTPWDLFMAGDESAMTERQIEGWEMFSEETVCDNCHQAPEFTDHQFYNIGLRPSAEDAGRENVSADSDDRGRFKTPTLRNVGLKTALMHTGWITDVRDAVDFYNVNADADNGIPNRHQQFTEDQTPIPTMANRPDVEYDTLSMFSRSDELKDTVVDFIANGLTDPRVAAEQFPFDRPTLASERLDAIENIAGISGAWFDPLHEGEGWLIQILSASEALVFWFTYNSDGNQMWLVGSAVITANTLVVDELQISEGAVFGANFNPDDVQLQTWGSMSMAFIDCNRAELAYQSINFGSGTLAPIRLTSPVGVDCD